MLPRLAGRGGLLAALVAFPAWPAAGQLPADTALLVDRVFSASNRTDSPGCALGLDRDGRPLYRRGYGMASLEFGVPWSENTVSESGSVAKQFTAGAIVYLALQGKLGLDDPVRKHIPELADYGSPVTIRMLLHHTSGIRDMWTLFGIAGHTLGNHLISTDQALRMVYRQRELNFPPNTQYLYSNSGYLLLAEIVRRVSGKPLAEFSQDVFFRPLGMLHTQWRDDWNRVVPNRATAYSSTRGGYRVDMPYMHVYGAGGLLTTIGDLLRWNEHLSHPTIGGAGWVDTLEQHGRLVSGKEIDYALGLDVTTYKSEREVSHGGATGGYRTFLARWPGRRLSLALLCNFGSADPDGLAHRVADVFFGGDAATATTAPAAAAALSPADLAVYAGRYRAPATEDVMAVSAADGKLWLDLGARVALTPVGPDRFRAFGSSTVAFERGPDGRVRTMRLILDDTTTFEPITVPAPTAAELALLAGSYYGPELDATYRLTAREGRLVVQVGDEPEMVLARSAPLAYGEPGRGTLRFTRDKSGRIDGFLLSAGRVRNLRFVRR